jgi:RHS repeat-associated protein
MCGPDLGRFLQPDPLGYFDGMNGYAYCGNNPVNWEDMEEGDQMINLITLD